MVFCLENGVRIVTTKKGKRKRMIACYFSKIITLFMQSFFLPAQPQKLKRNECVSLSLLWAFDQLTHMINKMKFFKWSTPGGGGWGVGVLPIMAEAGRPHTKRYHFQASEVYERVWISLVESYERVGKSIISVRKKTQMGNRCILSWL